MSPAPTPNGNKHRPTESTSQVSITDSVSLPHHHSGSSLVAPAAGSNWQDKLLTAFFKQIRDKLPCYSGKSLHELESDEPMSRSVDALIYMTRSRMGQIAWLLLELLEKLSKQTHDPSEKWRQDVLQSQLFVIKILSAAERSAVYICPCNTVFCTH